MTISEETRNGKKASPLRFFPASLMHFPHSLRQIEHRCRDHFASATAINARTSSVTRCEDT